MSQKIKSLDQDNVKFLCGLIRNIASIDSAINDLVIASDKVFSSKKVTELAQEVKHSLEQYIQSSINGLTHLKKKIVDVLPSDADAEENILYLVKDTSVVDDVVYNQYLLIDGVLEPLGSTNTDLSNYYNKDESDAKFALLSNLQTLIDMVGNASDLETTAKDTLVSAINEIKDGLDNCITKKYLHIELNENNVEEYMNDLNILTLPLGEYYIPKLTFGSTLLELPSRATKAGRLSVESLSCAPAKVNKNSLYEVTYVYRTFIYHDLDGRRWIRTLNTADTIGVFEKDTEWQKVCTTSVPDVPKITITSEAASNYTLDSNQSIYIVKNGVCYVYINTTCVSPVSTLSCVINRSLPKPINTYIHQDLRCISREITDDILATLTMDGVLYLRHGTANKNYVGTFSYPVAEE